LDSNTALTLDLAIGSQIPILGERFTVVGVTTWFQSYFEVYIPYKTLMELKEGYSLERYYAFPEQFSPGRLRESITVLLDSYAHALSFLEIIPGIVDIANVYPDARYLEEQMFGPLSERLLKPVYGACFVALGAIGFLRILRLRAHLKTLVKRIEFWLTLITLSLTLMSLYFHIFNFRWISRNYWAGTWLGMILWPALVFVFIGPFLPIASASFAIKCGVSLWRRRILGGIVNGLASAPGWVLTIFRYYYAIIPLNIRNLLITPIFPVFPYNILNLLLYTFPVVLTIAMIPSFVFLPRPRIPEKMRALYRKAKLYTGR
jgi:hypothetical protein